MILIQATTGDGQAEGEPACEVLRWRDAMEECEARQVGDLWETGSEEPSTRGREMKASSKLIIGNKSAAP